MSDIEESHVLGLKDVTHIGSTGLDFVEKLQDKLKAQQAVSSPQPSSQASDPLASFKVTRLDRP